MRKIDLTGARFGRLNVLKEEGRSNQGEVMWLCECECGNTKVCKGYLLRKGKIRSCGCLREEMRPLLNRIHGMSESDIYKKWKDMISRCHNPRDTGYKNYGGRGIKVCEEWKENLEAFAVWSIENGYRKGLTIDRINNEKGYSPDNCRWISMKEQLNNTRRNVFIEINGKTKTLAGWSDISGVSPNAIYGRYKRGDRGERLIRPTQKEYNHNPTGRNRSEIKLLEGVK